MKITQPGFYDIPEDAYHDDPVIKPSLSASIGKMLVSMKETPRHAWLAHPRLNPDHEAVREYNAAMAFGTVCHKLMLGKGDDVKIVEGFDDFRKGAARDIRDIAMAAGKTPILAAHYERAEQVVRAGKAQLLHHDDAADAFTDFRPEMCAVWQEGDIWCRALFDELPNSGNVVYDYKTVSGSANADQWAKQAFDLGADIQNGFYRRGFKKLREIKGDVHFRFVVQEMNAPFALNVVGFSPAAVALADARTLEAIRRWTWCMKHDAWPGHPKKVCYIDAPIWHERSWENNELTRELSKDRGEEWMEIMNNWQAPLEAAE